MALYVCEASSPIEVHSIIFNHQISSISAIFTMKTSFFFTNNKSDKKTGIRMATLGRETFEKTDISLYLTYIICSPNFDSSILWSCV